MEKEFVPYELALKLKGLGFDKPCFGFYQIEYAESIPTMVDDNEQYRLTGFRTCKNSEIPEHYVSAPTFSQAFRWFRKKYGIMHRITSYAFGYQIHLDNTLNTAIKYIDRRYDSELDYKSYEEAELACLTKLIEIVESKSE